MFFVLIKRPNALLQRQQRLVDLRPIHPCLFALIDRIRPPLTPRQVDERDLAVQSIARILKADLEDGVGAGGVHVGAGDACGADAHAEGDGGHEFFDRGDGLLG